MTETADDAAVFGPEGYVYCRQHMRPHSTGWCTVDSGEKVGLGILVGDGGKTYAEAAAKCRSFGLPLFEDLKS